MRNANAQRPDSMIRVAALRQPPTPHVRHAETGGWFPECEIRRRRCIARLTYVGRRLRTREENSNDGATKYALRKAICTRGRLTTSAG